MAAHLAALRVAAVVLALRARPGLTPRRPRNAWLVLAEVAPELAEWAAFFAATYGKREAVRSGATAAVSAREADDLLRDAQAFLSLVERAVERSRSAQAGGPEPASSTTPDRYPPHRHIPEACTADSHPPGTPSAPTCDPTGHPTTGAPGSADVK